MPDLYELLADPAPAVNELESWIRDERHPDWKVERGRKQGENIREQLGGEYVLELIIAAGGVGALARCINNWIKYRRPHAKVTIKKRNGSEVTVDATNSGDVEEIMRALRADKHDA